MMKFKMVSFLVMLSIHTPLVCARVVDIDLSLYGKGTMLANSPREKQSAEYWHQLSNKIIASEARLGTQVMWQYAGLSEALAAIAANKRNDIKAYEYWSNSTRYLLTGGTEWPQMQKSLHRRYEQINTQLSSQLIAADIGISLDNQWQQELTILQVWDSKLGVFTFKGPKLGLKSKGSSPPLVSTPNTIPAKGYHSTRSMNSSGNSDKKKLTGLNGGFSRGKSFTPTVTTEEIKEGNTMSETLITNAIIPQDQPEQNATPTTKKIEEIKQSQVIIITPDEEFDYRLVEQNKNQLKMQAEEVEIPQKVEAIEYNPIHKANIGTENKNKVEVLQRRTFTPVITDESNSN